MAQGLLALVLSLPLSLVERVVGMVGKRPSKITSLPPNGGYRTLLPRLPPRWHHQRSHRVGWERKWTGNVAFAMPPHPSSGSTTSARSYAPPLLGALARWRGVGRRGGAAWRSAPPLPVASAVEVVLLLLQENHDTIPCT